MTDIQSTMPPSLPSLPNPGSPKVIRQGCLCPEKENNYGAGVIVGDCPIPEFWINLDCPLHGGYKVGKAKRG